MLHAMRKGASGWLAKGLLVLLVASFAVWGIGSDMLGSSVGSDVIEVGDQTVTIGEFQREYQNRLNQISQYVGRRITPEQAEQFGVTQSTILNLTRTMLETERVKQLNLGVNDAAVLDEIRNGPAFKNTAGAFDRFRFQETLRQNGYSEAEYVEILRLDLMRRQLVSSFALPENDAPQILVETLFNYAGEKRSARFVALADGAVTNVPTPTDEQLTQFIKDNPASFTAPEYRKATYLSVTPEDFKDQVDVTEDELSQEYEGRSSEFDTPERRNILQMIFDNEEDAIAAATKITGGTSFTDVAQETLQLTPTDIDLGEIIKTDLFNELQEPVFAIDLNGVTAPVKSSLGWHLVKVSSITPASTKSLEEVKEQLKNDVALRKAEDVVFEKATALQDEFAGGASVAEAGEATGIQVINSEWIDTTGKNEAGAPVNGLPAAQSFLPELFGKTKDADIDLTETPARTYYAVSVTDIRDAALRSLVDVKEQAMTAWKADWQHQENKKKAEALLEKLKGGTSLEEIASETKTDVKESTASLRGGPVPGLSRDAVSSLFGLKEGDYAVAANDTKTGYVLYSLKDVVPADKAASTETVQNLEQQLVRSVQQDIEQQYQSYLEKEIGVSVKEGLIREYFSGAYPGASHVN
ncbi:MAG: SurA N-terminal domain-containing protein [Sneathiella sp.]